MLNCSPDIPFGARALERGVQVEGIWVSSSETVDQIPKEFTRPNPNTTSRPTTPMTGSPLKMMDTNDDGPDSFPRFPSASHAANPSKPVDGNATSDDGNLSGSSNAPRASQQSYRTVATYPETQASQDPGQQRQSTQWFGPRSSWITRPMSYKRWSGVSQGGLSPATGQQVQTQYGPRLIRFEYLFRWSSSIHRGVQTSLQQVVRRHLPAEHRPSHCGRQRETVQVTFQTLVKHHPSLHLFRTFPRSKTCFCCIPILLDISGRW